MNLKGLEKYIPENALEFIELWLKPFDFKIHIKNARKNKLGDYRIPRKGEKHQITVNNNLSEELCFLVLTHEIAHMIAFHEKRTILPHGIEWKNAFSKLILESFEVYSQEFKTVLLEFSKNPKANFYADKRLAHFFLSLEKEYKNLDDINEGEKFILNKRTFIKLKKKNSKYICREIKSGKEYLVNSLAPIEIL